MKDPCALSPAVAEAARRVREEGFAGERNVAHPPWSLVTEHMRRGIRYSEPPSGMRVFIIADPFPAIDLPDEPIETWKEVHKRRKKHRLSA